jgi:hypothetical protein
MVKKVMVRVLLDCAYGAADDVVELDAATAAAAAKSGEVDPHPDAVAYALSLPQNQPKPSSPEVH